jgi:hypothetical protein
MEAQMTLYKRHLVSRFETSSGLSMELLGKIDIQNSNPYKMSNLTAFVL